MRSWQDRQTAYGATSRMTSISARRSSLNCLGPRRRTPWASGARERPCARAEAVGLAVRCLALVGGRYEAEDGAGNTQGRQSGWAASQSRRRWAAAAPRSLIRAMTAAWLTVRHGWWALGGYSGPSGSSGLPLSGSYRCRRHLLCFAIHPAAQPHHRLPDYALAGSRRKGERPGHLACGGASWAAR